MIAVFLDFNGLPGSGKTTLSLRLVQALQNAGTPALLFQEYIDRHIKSNLDSLKVFFGGLVRMSPARFWVFVRFCGSLPREAPRRIYRCYLLMLNYILYRNCAKENGTAVIVSEQCVIQEVLSCYYSQPIPKDRNSVLPVLKLLGEDYCAVNVKLSTASVIQRLKGRKNGESRLDAMCDETGIEAILRVQELNLSYIRDCMRSAGIRGTEISTEDPPEENVSRIMERLNLGGSGK